MRVAWFGHVAGRRGNGLITYSREVTAALRRAGHDVVVFYHGGSETDEQSPDHIRIGALDILDRTVISSIDAPRIIANVLRERGADVAHASLSWSLLDFALPDVCHEQNIPIVCTLHFPYDPHSSLMGSLSRTMYRVYATVLARYDYFIVFSHAQRTMLAGMGFPQERVAVIPNGVDETMFSPGPSDYRQRIGADTLITYLGRVDPEKNVGALCETFVQLDPPTTTRLVVVGGGMELGALRRRYGGDERILFTGVVRDVAARIDILRASDVYVLPSRVEGLSLALLEAMACGCPCIATDVGSDGEALRGAGLVIDPENTPAQLRLALETLLTYPEFRRSLGVLARQRVVERFSLRKNVEQVIQLYQTVAQGA